MTTLTLNINDLEKLAKNGNDDLVILTKNEYNELIQKIKDLEYWNKIDKRIENIKVGNAYFHELIEVDDE